MSEVGYLAALLLAAVFVAAGTAKLARRSATAATFASLGVPAPAALASGVPILEIVLAVVLVVRPWVGGVLALAALAGFTVLLVRTLSEGAAVPCGCFGSAASEPVSFVEVVRNVLLAVAAAAALWAPRPDAPGLDAVVLTTTAAMIALVVLALFDVRRRLGAVWRTTLPGEARQG